MRIERLETRTARGAGGGRLDGTRTDVVSSTPVDRIVTEDSGAPGPGRRGCGGTTHFDTLNRITAPQLTTPLNAGLPRALCACRVRADHTLHGMI